MIHVLLETLTTIDANEQAQRAADAAWESAKWAFLMLILTVGLLVGAFRAARYAKKTWEDTNSQLKMARQAEREREASNVSAWLQPAKSGDLVEVFVRNGNGGPVYDVVCDVQAKEKSAEAPGAEVITEEYTALGPEDAKPSKAYAFNLGPDGYVFSYVDPVSKTRYNFKRGTTVIFDSKDDWKIWDGKRETGGLAVQLSFRDSAGRRWRRDWHGKLTEVR